MSGLSQQLQRERRLVDPAQLAADNARHGQRIAETRALVRRYAEAEEIDFLGDHADLWDTGNSMCALLVEIDERAGLELSWSGADFSGESWSSDDASANTCAVFMLGEVRDGRPLLAVEFPDLSLARLRNSNAALIRSPEGLLCWDALRDRLIALARG